MDVLNRMFFKGKGSQTAANLELSPFVTAVLVMLFILGSLVLLLGLSTFAYVSIRDGWRIGSSEDFGYFGSFYGGILGSFAALLSAIIFWVALRKQMIALNESNHLLAASEAATRAATSQQKNLFRLEQLMKQFDGPPIKRSTRTMNLCMMKTLRGPCHEIKTFFGRADRICNQAARGRAIDC